MAALDPRIIEQQLVEHFCLHGRVRVHPTVANRPFKQLADNLLRGFVFAKPFVRTFNGARVQIEGSLHRLYNPSTKVAAELRLDVSDERKRWQLVSSRPGIYCVVFSALLYVEVTVVAEETLKAPLKASLGVTTFPDVDESGLVGTRPNEVGLNFADGRLQIAGTTKDVACKRIEPGDVVGVGFDASTLHVFFTVNGNILHCLRVGPGTFAIVFISRSLDVFRMNTGKSPFTVPFSKLFPAR